MRADIKSPSNSEETVRLLQEELALTNREVMQLTLELETRLDQLRTAEERYRRLAENAPDMIYRYDLRAPQGITFINPQATTITGYSTEEFYRDPALCLKIVDREDRALFEPVLRGESPAGKAILMRWIHKSGTTVWIEQHHTLVRDAEGGVIAVECIARDVTGSHHLEEQFRQAQKMEAIGRLAGGVAHDFNNLLTVILGYAAHLLSTPPLEIDSREAAEEIQKAGERAATLTRQLLAFSRRQILQPRVLDLNTIVSGMDKMLSRLIGAGIRYTTVPSPVPAFVRADAGQMEQVLMNLVVNARDAMPSGGTLTVEIATTGSNVTLAVTDTGQGMDEGTQKRIFEPFFTTKPAGVGTGLGLSTVYGIVTQSGGRVSVQSTVGAGTTFSITLPAAAQATEPAVEERAAQKPGAGKETILVVEDEPSVRGFVITVLRRAGYHILSAPTGDEAIQLAGHYEGEIHLLLTDMSLPGMRGDQLAQRLAVARPNLKMLLMSGNADASVGTTPELTVRTPFLPKPFTPSTLARTVRATLDGQ